MTVMEREKTLLPSNRHSGAHLDRPCKAPIRTAVGSNGRGSGLAEPWVQLNPGLARQGPSSAFCSVSTSSVHFCEWKAHLKPFQDSFWPTPCMDGFSPSLKSIFGPTLTVVTCTQIYSNTSWNMSELNPITMLDILFP
jgi:hypothetical protein